MPELSSGSIPIIAVETQAPEADTAAKLADQSVVILRQQLDSLAGTEAIPAARRVTIRELGPARSTTQLRGPSRMLAGAATYRHVPRGLRPDPRCRRRWSTTGATSPRRSAAPRPAPVARLARRR